MKIIQLLVTFQKDEETGNYSEQSRFEILENGVSIDGGNVTRPELEKLVKEF